MVIGSWYTGWAVTFNTTRRGPGRAAAPLSPLLAVPNETAHLQTASVPTSYYSTCHYTHNYLYPLKA